ncbi:unnamed protein product [Amoebophrya sp. A120]|nr:unnamed protein product [Amoebophrya sp. A120]|eukprot:GSA120T00019184001.1
MLFSKMMMPVDQESQLLSLELTMDMDTLLTLVLDNSTTAEPSSSTTTITAMPTITASDLILRHHKLGRTHFKSRDSRRHYGCKHSGEVKQHQY